MYDWLTNLELVLSGICTICVFVMEGFYKAEAGSKVLINGADISSVPLVQLRRTARLIPQTPTLFGTTIRSALVGTTGETMREDGPTISDDEVWLTLARVNMACAVRSLPQALDTQVKYSIRLWFLIGCLLGGDHG